MLAPKDCKLNCKFEKPLDHDALLLVAYICGSVDFLV